MKPTISRNIIYIGQDDRDADIFEGQYALPEGMCYNSYLIRDTHTAIIDTVDASVGEAWKTALDQALAGVAPEYLVAHHMEPDHASLIVWALERYPSLTLVASAKAMAMLPLYFPEYDFAGRTMTVAEGDTLELGEHSLRFIAAPMVHWPEVMVSWEASEGLLFSADAFGKFGVYGADPEDWACEARRYYFNICGKYGAPVQALLKKVAPLNINKILPLHGHVLEGGAMAEALRLYGIWSAYGNETPGVFVAYGSFHGNTAKAALCLADLLREAGCPKVAVSDLARDDAAEAVEDAFRYPVTVFAATTYDGAYNPAVQRLLHTLRAKGWQGKTVAFIENGSWAPQAARLMRADLEGCKALNFIDPPVTIRGALKDGDIPALKALAESLVKAVNN